MTDWIAWLIMAGVLVILELFIGTFYLLMIALSLTAASLAAFAGAGISVQLIVAAFVGALTTYALRRFRAGKTGKRNSARDPNINLDIGQQITVKEWDMQTAGASPSARVMYRGALWDVELAEGAAQPGIFFIREMRGSRLIVTDHLSNNN